jgi:FkbM family methyltransferase
MLSEYAGAFVVLSVSGFYFSEILRQLGAMGVPQERIVTTMYDMVHLRCALEDIEREEGFKWAYEYFTDENCRKIITQKIRAYLFNTGLDCASGHPQYFNREILTFTDDEVFIDGGAFTGDSTLNFIRCVNGKYKHIYCFEPDIEVFETAKANVLEYHDVHLIPKGLWNKNAYLEFSGGLGGGSSFEVDLIHDKFGNISASPTVQLDSMFSDKPLGEWPTFIKMDIEGAEKNAILGMENIIKTCHPKLAICVYHKREDIWEIPQTILRISPTYRMTLCHYSDSNAETVLYAV